MLARLRELREERGITQRALAEVIGVSQQSINKYENHNIEPDIRTLIALADFFGTTVDDLVGRGGAASEDAPRAGTAPTAEEQQLLLNYRRLNRSQRESICAVIDNYLRIIK